MLPEGSARPEEEAEGGGAPKLDHGGLLGLATVSMTINLAACEPPPPVPGLDKDAYFIALSGIFLAGVAHVFAAVCASDDDPRGRAGGGHGARSKIKHASVVAAFVVAAGLSVASFMW
ncbi:unnamed protein product [Urochloa humidicola]